MLEFLEFYGSLTLIVMFMIAVIGFGMVWRSTPAAEPPTPIPGVCTKCGYDLRATPDRCPECGTLAPGGSSLNDL